MARIRTLESERVGGIEVLATALLLVLLLAALLP